MLNQREKINVFPFQIDRRRRMSLLKYASKAVCRSEISLVSQAVQLFIHSPVYLEIDLSRAQIDRSHEQTTVLLYSANFNVFFFLLK